MTVKYCIKTYGDVINDAVSTRYSDPSLDAVLAVGERFYVVAMTTKVIGTFPKITIGLQVSNDGLSWFEKQATPVIYQATISLSGAAVVDGADDGVTNSEVGGRFMRVSVKLLGGATSAYVDIWVCGRSLA